MHHIRRMQITSFSDYGLRILMTLAVMEERRVSSRELATRLSLSFDHVAKITRFLAREGYVEATRGRNGGLRLARPAEEIMIGDVLRRSEAGSGLVECMRSSETQCVLAPLCGLAPMLADAQERFFAALDASSIADALPGRAAMRALVERGAA